MDVNDCFKCEKLVENRNCIVNGEGSEDADILFVGEAPGKKEDEKGRPFIGKSGKILRDRIEKDISKKYRITNSVRCRPPDNRDPDKDELSNCHNYLINEIKQINPEIIVSLGKIPCKSLLGEEVSTIKNAGKEYSITIKNKNYIVVICPHPAATIYNNQYEDIFEDTIRSIEEKIDRKDLDDFM